VCGLGVNCFGDPHAMWLAADPIDMRADAQRLLARVVQVFGAHHRRTVATCSRTLATRASSCWCATASACGARHVGSTPGASSGPARATPLLSITPAQFNALDLGLPWQRPPELSVIGRA